MAPFTCRHGRGFLRLHPAISLLPLTQSPALSPPPLRTAHSDRQVNVRKCSGKWEHFGSSQTGVQIPGRPLPAGANMGGFPLRVSGFHLGTVGTHERGFARSLAEDKGAINERDWG